LNILNLNLNSIVKLIEFIHQNSNDRDLFDTGDDVEELVSGIQNFLVYRINQLD
jgi:hypothetical protein